MQQPILFGAPPGVRAGAVADLLARDHEVFRTGDLAAALAECRRRLPAVAVLPWAGGADEAEVLRFLREQGGRTAVFLYAEAGPLPLETAYRVLAAGARGLLDARAPDFPDDLGRRLERLLRDLRLRQAEDEARATLFARHDLAGASPAMRDVFRRAIKASQLDELPVLIEGEKGTPKHRLASAILHLDPSRQRMPFFALSCAELTRVLGNPRGPVGGGGPTLAERWRELLRGARGGALFLDDIGALAPQLQRILLVVMHRQPAGVRVIAAAEDSPEERVRAGRFDAELFDRISLFRIPLPPLRGRPEDIAAQARHALHAMQAGHRTSVADFGPGVIEALQRLPWEGNTYQLERVLRQALATKEDGGTLLLDDLPAWARPVPLDAPPPQPLPHPGDWVSTDAVEDCHPMDRAAELFERRLLQAILKRQVGDRESVRPDHEIDHPV